MLTVLLVVVSVAVYLNIGFFFGHLNWVVCHELNRSMKLYREMIWGKILWPISRGKRREKTDRYSLEEPMQAPITYMSESGYKLVMSIFWPIKLIYLTIAGIIALALGIMCIIFMVIYAIYTIAKILLLVLLKIATYPIRKFVGVNGISEMKVGKILKDALDSPSW